MPVRERMSFAFRLVSMTSYPNLLLVGVLLFGYTCSNVSNNENPATHEPVDTTTTVVEQPQRVLSFDADIKPILQTRCSPCHFPGGKMYDKMPFDKTLTIRKHSVGILGRIKGEEAEKIKAFLEQ